MPVVWSVFDLAIKISGNQCFIEDLIIELNLNVLLMLLMSIENIFQRSFPGDSPKVWRGEAIVMQYDGIKNVRY